MTQLQIELPDDVAVEVKHWAEVIEKAGIRAQ